MSEKRYPLWLQYSILICIFGIVMLIGSIMIGKAEYIKGYCEDTISEPLEDGDKVALLRDMRGKEISYACCKVPQGAEKISISKNCVYVDNYQNPTFNEKISNFLKKFK